MIKQTLAAVTLGLSLTASWAQDINFGIISTEATQNLKADWQPLIDDMAKQTGLKVTAFFAPDYAGVIEAMRFNKVHVAWYGNKSAIEAVDRQGLPRPRCVGVIETCEESGSPDLPAYLDALRTRLGNVSLVVCLDSGAGNYDQLWLTTSLRGMVSGVLKVEILTEGVHSGDSSGVVPSSFRILRHLLDRLEDSATGRLLPASFHCTVPAERLAQLRERSDLQVRLRDLTDRERDVMDLVVAGLPNKLIADQLDISVRTVEVHRSRVFDKMQVKSAVELANLLRTEK